MSKLLLALGLGAMIGCTGIHPVGPFANPNAGPKAGSKKDRDKDEPPEPVMVPAPKPTPPLNTTGPEDVNPDNPHLALQKLQQELESDGKTIQTPSKTAEISRYKNGVKQN